MFPQKLEYNPTPKKKDCKERKIQKINLCTYIIMHSSIRHWNNICAYMQKYLNLWMNARMNVNVYVTYIRMYASICVGLHAYYEWMHVCKCIIHAFICIQAMYVWMHVCVHKHNDAYIMNIHEYTYECMYAIMYVCMNSLSEHCKKNVEKYVHPSLGRLGRLLTSLRSRAWPNWCSTE